MSLRLTCKTCGKVTPHRAHEYTGKRGKAKLAVVCKKCGRDWK